MSSKKVGAKKRSAESTEKAAEVNDKAAKAKESTASQALSSKMAELLIVEYDARLERYRQLAGHMSQLQHWALVTTGALWAWILSRTQSGDLVIAGWIPVLANTVFCTKAHLIGGIAQGIYSRLNTIVRQVGQADPNYVTEWEPENWKTWSVVFWGGVLVLSIGMALAYTVRYFFA